ncbi:hypothetical protein GCM10010172_38890 [Paractinoplanes ferrugineus]|uniref:Uncharacterized protein n=1 Tax=Paractinoplanes ferrugineus TaxID=113564 RepID=A0A919J2A4_9ACTN|nr:hypothetical protein [Actinoplanes ferrugineus]GIE12665.1 hypothetical protein Afe05nite_45050 [Actinoplanes ferrugineus]
MTRAVPLTMLVRMGDGVRRWIPPALARPGPTGILLAWTGALLAWTALATPLSVTIGEYFAYYDPQSDPERLAYHRDLAAHVYTAGHWLGQLLAALAGAWLVTRRPGPATMLRVALAGGLLGLFTGVVAILAGRPAMHSNGYPSVAPDPTMLSDPAVRWCLLSSLACFPLWALLGAAVGRLARRRALLATVAVMLAQPATLLLVVGIAAPPSSHPFAVAMIVDDSRLAGLMPFVVLAWVALATAGAAIVSRRRLS